MLDISAYNRLITELAVIRSSMYIFDAEGQSRLYNKYVQKEQDLLNKLRELCGKPLPLTIRAR